MMEIKAEDILKKFHKIASEYGLKQKNTTKAKVHWKDIELDVNNEKCTIDKKRGIVAWNYKRKNAMQKLREFCPDYGNNPQPKKPIFTYPKQPPIIQLLEKPIKQEKEFFEEVIEKDAEYGEEF